MIKITIKKTVGLFYGKYPIYKINLTGKHSVDKGLKKMEFKK